MPEHGERTPFARPLTRLVQVAALGVVYYGAARLGLRYASIGQSISLVWPPTGLAIAALAILGLGAWPGVALGAFLANAATPVPLAVAAAIAAGNTLEAVLAAGIIRRVAGPRPTLDNMRTVRALVTVAAPAGAVISAIIGVTALIVSGVLPGARAAQAIAVWWTGDLLGALVVAPVLIAWGLARPTGRAARGPIEVALLCLGTVVAAELGFGHLLPVTGLLRRLDYLYLLFPFVIWAALRFGSRGASLMAFTVAVVAVWRTVAGGGPFNTGTGGGTLFAVGCYLGIVAVTGLLLAAAVTVEREAATAELRRRDEQLHVALDAARMGVWAWSPTDDRLSWDPALDRLYGVAVGTRVSRLSDFLDRVHADDRGRVEATIRQVLAEGGHLNQEFRIVLPDGRIRWIENQGHVVAGGDGAVELTGTSTDVTDRRAAEDQLRLAHRMESVGRLAGGVAHEANNQMSVVIGAASFILARSDLPPAVRADAEHVLRAAERTAAVTSQLLAFSRQQVLKPRVIRLDEVLDRFRPVLQRTLGEDCAVIVRTDPALGSVRADPGQLEQVLLNLALNARDAMPRGGTLTVETSAVELTEQSGLREHGVAVRPGRYARLAVSDTGHGMDPATLAHAFEPFFTTKGVGQGTGLGLATVYGIVKQSDGYVFGSSEPGGGTTFTIYLPLAEEPSAATTGGGREAPRASGELVLLVEDEAQVRTIAARVLSEAGFRVLEAESGAGALALLEGAPGRVSLLLTDVVMPGMSGPELAEELARRSPGTPVLFTSGYTDSEIVRRGLLAPGAAFLAKPFSPDALVREVQARLRAATTPQRT